MALLGNSNDLWFKPTSHITGLSTGIGRNTQQFPTTIAGLSALCGYTPNSIYSCQETTGDIFNQSAGGVLLDFGPTATDYSRKTPWGNRKAIRTSKDNVGFWGASDPATVDPGSGSFACLMIGYGGTTTGNEYVALRTEVVNGWQFQRRTTGWFLYVDDGDGPGVSLTLSTAVPTDQVHAVIFGYDTYANQAFIASSCAGKVAVANASIAGLTMANYIGANAYLRKGTPNSYEHNTAYMAYWLGAQASWYGKEVSILNKLFGA
jgi:hypothetical protein